MLGPRNDLNTGNVGGPNRFAWFSSIFKSKAVKDPDPPELRQSIDTVSHNRFPITGNQSSDNPRIGLLGRIARFLKGSVTKTSATAVKVEMQQPKMIEQQQPKSVKADILLDTTDTTERHKKALEKVKKDGMNLQNLQNFDPVDQKNKEIIKAAIDKDPMAFQFAKGPALAVSMDLLRKEPSLLKEAPVTVQMQFAELFLRQLDETNVGSDLKVITQLDEGTQSRIAEANPRHLKYFSPKIQAELCLKTPEKFLSHATDDIQLELIKDNGPRLLLQHASEDVQTSYLEDSPGYSKFASDQVNAKYPKISERGEAFRAVMQDGMALKKLAKQHQADLIIAEAAVKKNPNAFQFIQRGTAQLSASLHLQRELKKDPSLFQTFDLPTQTALIKASPLFLQYAKPETQLKYINQHKYLIEYASPDVKARLNAQNKAAD